jgi:lipopolysaccharide export system ATP-binding protein
MIKSIFEGQNLTITNKASELIFDNFSFQINEGEIWMVAGPNGIGKSSLYEALIGLRPMQEGKIYLDHHDITNLYPEDKVRLGMKYIAQSNALFEDASILENLKIFAYSLVEKTKRKQAIENAIELFDLRSLLNRKISQLSGGQKRRVELSKIVIGPAHFIMLDEPFAAIDHARIENICKVFQEIAAKGSAFFINDHTQEPLRKIASFCINLGHGPKKEVLIEKLN